MLDVPVTYAEAALGASVEIPTPEGPVSLKVPSGTESGKLLRVKGRGVPHLKGIGRGDLLARVKVTVPKKLSKAEKEALEGYQKVSREHPREVFAREPRPHRWTPCRAREPVRLATRRARSGRRLAADRRPAARLAVVLRRRATLGWEGRALMPDRPAT